MRKYTQVLIIAFVALFNTGLFAQTGSFVSVRGHKLFANGKPYYFVGANYWYGSLLGLEKDKRRGVDRLRSELDFLKSQGITNLRLLGGAEGTGLLNGVNRVGPPLQPEQGKFDESVLNGLDLVLSEMGKRNMRAVIFLSNNWEWSGGFQQYLIWNKVIGADFLTKKPSWDELRDAVAKFYTCEPCMAGYDRQAAVFLTRINKYTKKRYIDDPTIMAWELANEPRPMRPSADQDYARWITSAAAMIKSKDPHHLVTIGHEGKIGTENIALYEKINGGKDLDYMTIHIWPKNWGWFADGKLADGFPNVLEQSVNYANENIAVAKKLNKPMIIEEFGLPRDGQSFDPSASTSFRDRYYARILAFVGGGSGPGDEYVAGANFWAFGGSARPIKGQIFWKDGDDRMGDPPMEEQGLNSIFDRDQSTWSIIKPIAISKR